MLLDELQCLPFRLHLSDLTGAHALDEPVVGVVGDVPLVHHCQLFLRLVDGEARSLGDDVQFRIGDERGDLDDAVDIGVESGELAVYPDEVRFGHLH